MYIEDGVNGLLVPVGDMQTMAAACKKLGADFLFVGDDWYETEKWKEYEKEFQEAGIQIVYFPYTQGTSSTQIRKALKAVRDQDLMDVK